MELMYSRLVSEELYPTWLDQESMLDIMLQSFLSFRSYNQTVMIKTKRKKVGQNEPRALLMLALCAATERKTTNGSINGHLNGCRLFSIMHSEKHPLQRNRLVATCVGQLRLYPMEPCSDKT